MVKEIIELPLSGDSRKMDLLKVDVRKIIQDRIQICEIVNPPYPNSTMRERLQKAIRMVLWEYAERNKDGKLCMPSRREVFKVSNRNIDGQCHWYVTFDINRWDKEWQQFREENSAT